MRRVPLYSRYLSMIKCESGKANPTATAGLLLKLAAMMGFAALLFIRPVAERPSHLFHVAAVQANAQDLPVH